MNGDVNNKEERNYAMLLTSMSEMYKPTNKPTNTKTHGIIGTTINLCLNILTYPKTSIIFNQHIHRFVTVMKLGLVQMKILSFLFFDSGHRDQIACSLQGGFCSNPRTASTQSLDSVPY